MKKKLEPIEKPRFNRAGYQVNLKALNGEPLPDLGKLEFRTFNHGGARAGAGRKPSGRKPVLLRLSPKLIASLKKEAGREHKTLSDVAEERLACGTRKIGRWIDPVELLDTSPSLTNAQETLPP